MDLPLRLNDPPAKSEAPRSPIRLRLTRPGLWLVGVLCVLLLMAMNYRNNANYLLFAVMAGCTVVAALEARRNLTGVTVIAERGAPVFAGEAPRLLLRLQIPDQRPRSLLRVAALGRDCVLLEAHDGDTADLDLPAMPRGVHRIATCRLTSSHPFGLFAIRREVPLTSELLVYPKPEGERPLPGERNDGSRGGEAEDFAGHRRYQPGDAPQHIDWKVAARSNRFLVKRFSADRDLRRHQLVFSELVGCEVETALSQLCRWVCLAEEQHEPYSLDLAGGGEVGTGPEHQRRCLEALARHGH
jgi:uncharacterized protein (DUF58 family)